MVRELRGTALAELANAIAKKIMSDLQNQEWYVVYSKPQKEDFAQFHLKQKGVEVFFPRLLLPRSSRKRKLLVPLFPNYLFVRIDLWRHYYAVLWSPGVKNFVSFNDTPAALDSRIAQYLLQRTNGEGIIAAQSNLKVGQEVRIRGGSFDGLVGMLQDAPDARGRVKVLMKLLNREIKVEIPVHLVAGSWVPHGPDDEVRI
jgi:transcriptional antiterminator RfaH